MKTIRIEKRVPFGFRGDWGKLYKEYDYEELSSDLLTIKYQDTSYADIGQDVQFKPLEDGVDKKTNPTEPVENRESSGEYRIMETTDAYFDDDTGQFVCVAGIGDIVNVLGDWWIVDSIEDKSIYTPKKQTFYMLGLKKVDGKLIKQ